MAVISMQKIKLVASGSHKQKLLDSLQSLGALEITEIIDEKAEERELINQSPEQMEALHSVELNIANIDFALKLIKPYAKHRNLIQGPLVLTIDDVKKKAKEFNFDTIIKQCRTVEETMVALRNELAALQMSQEELGAWQSLSMPLDHIGETERTKTILGTIQKTAYAEFVEDIKKVSKLLNVDKINEDESTTYVALTFAKEVEPQVKEVFMMHKLSEVDLPSRKHDVKTELKEIKERKSEIEQDLANQEEELKVLAKKNEDLQIVHDYFVWERDKMYSEQKAYNTKSSFTLEGWVPLKNLKKINERLEKVTNAFEIFEIEPTEEEQAPVAIKNKGLIGSFEAVTNIYGLPLPSEIDPTPFLAAFFIIFFGLCLTDAGYGIVLFVICALALKFLKIPAGMKNLVKLLMFGGIVTFILGALFGGWFGMTADQAPGFLTYVDESGEMAFRWQIINPTKGSGPLTFLMLAAVLGYVQVLFGVLVDGYWKIKHGKYIDALFDSFLWFYFLIIMGLFGLSKGGIFLPEYAGAITYLVYFGVGALILTQGRKQKNIILKFLTGVLSLYGLVGYFADVLSYSRLMALGLGTGIIGFAFNTIAGLVGSIPYIGIVFAIIVILIGHTLNIAISTLGAFIHSSRLQFVEFFGKFMEGGGKAFKPLQKACKYILITEKK
ncbi:V-type ATP synthase subunit I [Patescibacteria group bacterium]